MATTTQVGGVLSQARRMSRGRRIVAVAGVAVAVVLAVGVVQLRSSDSLRTAANLDRSAVTVGAEGASITGVTASGAADNVDVLRAADGRTGAGSAGSAASAASADSTKSLSAGGRIAPPPPVSVAAIPSGGPRVVRTVDLRLEVAANGMADVMGQVAVIANGAGGFVQSSSSTASTPSAVVRDPGASPVTVPARATASAVIRVPSQRSAEVTEALAKLGKVVGRSEQGQDVTGQLVDLDSRLRNLRAQEDALRTLVARAGSVG